MLFKTSPVVALTSVLATLALANPDPQTPSQTTEVVADLYSYYLSVETDPAFLSLVSVLETDPGALSTLAAFEHSLVGVAANHGTLAADFLSGLPTEAQSFFGSVYTAEVSIAQKDGFTKGARTSGPTGTVAGGATSATSGNTAPTGKALGLSAAALGGFVAVIAAL